MWARLSIVAGLAVGVVAAGLLLGGLLALAPDAPLPSVAAPSAAVASAVPSEIVGPSPSADALASSAPSGAAIHVGQPAPPLVVPRVGGGTIDLASLRGKPVWIDFMATWCSPCQDEFPLMNGFAARYADQGLVVIAVDVEEEEATVATFAAGLGTTFPLGLDSDRSAAVAWDALALPVHFWIDADGIVRDRALGGIGPDVMVRGLGSIMPGVDVTP
jgi:cytochrome c biogenesis protein CcmG/thiol:disulfide interchange protein DsbE